jgi:hypothetical protein
MGRAKLIKNKELLERKTGQDQFVQKAAQPVIVSKAVNTAQAWVREYREATEQCSPRQKFAALFS